MHKIKVIFFCSSSYVIPIIEVLRQNFDLVLVVTTEKLTTDPIPSYCKNHQIPYLAVSSLSDPNFKFQISNFKFQIGVLASFGAIIPNEILRIFPKGIINIHPSLLPKYRGPSPVQAAILNGDKTTGVTIIKLDDKVDHGPILAQKEEPIFENDTSESLYERLFRLASSSIVSTIKLYLKGKITPREQDHSKATFTKTLTRQHGYIDLQNPPSPEKLDRMIRAYYPWPGVWTQIRISHKGLRIKFLPEKKIHVEGKKPVDIETFKRGYHDSINSLGKLFGK